MSADVIANGTDQHPPHSKIDVSAKAFWDAPAEERETTFRTRALKRP